MYWLIGVYDDSTVVIVGVALLASLISTQQQSASLGLTKLLYIA